MVASAINGILGSADTTPTKSDKIRTMVLSFGSDIFDNDGSTCQKLCYAFRNDYGSFGDLNNGVKILSQFIKPESLDDVKTREPVPYSLEEFSRAVEFAIIYEGSISTNRIQDYTATLITRLQALQEGVGSEFLDKTEFSTLGEYLEDLLGKSQVVNIDISGIDDSSGEVVTKVLAKLLLDHAKLGSKKADRPINLIIEEAHRYIKNEVSYGAVGYDIFERIAKEGRKYGLLLGISSQRPSELSKTVVSQCSNFIIHRVQNPEDLQYLSRMVPYVDRTTIERLTYLQTGTALVFGTAINLPTLTRIEAASPPTDSANARISEKWYVK